MLNSLGKWKVSILETGNFRLDGGAMMGSVPKILWRKTNKPDENNCISLAMRCLLLDDGDRCILIESGIGNKFNDKFKNMFKIEQTTHPLSYALSKAGYNIDSITDVVLTHLHFDHAGGATVYNEEGQLVPTFPNARYHISESNWNAAIDSNPRDRASYLPENYLPIEEAGILHKIPDNSEFLPGLTSYIVNGHTFGQQLIKVEDEGKTLVFCSDLIPIRSHLKLPWIMGYDLNAYLTLQEKTIFLKEAAKEGWWLFFYHDPKTAAVKITSDKKYYKVIKEVFINE